MVTVATKKIQGNKYSILELFNDLSDEDILDEFPYIRDFIFLVHLGSRDEFNTFMQCVDWGVPYNGKIFYKPIE